MHEFDTVSQSVNGLAEAELAIAIGIEDRAGGRIDMAINFRLTPTGLNADAKIAFFFTIRGPTTGGVRLDPIESELFLLLHGDFS
jgi:hypothetical protein